MLKLAKEWFANEQQRHVFYIENVELCVAKMTEIEERYVFLKKNQKNVYEKAVFVDRCNGNDRKGTKADNPNTAKRLTQIYF